MRPSRLQRFLVSVGRVTVPILHAYFHVVKRFTLECRLRCIWKKRILHNDCYNEEEEMGLERRLPNKTVLILDLLKLCFWIPLIRDWKYFVNVAKKLGVVIFIFLKSITIQMMQKYLYDIVSEYSKNIQINTSHGCPPCIYWTWVFRGCEDPTEMSGGHGRI